jgi:PAS domain S-box-containing protein
VQPEDFGIGTLFQIIREAVIVADAGTERIVLWNDAATRIFGYSEAEALQMPLHSLVPEELRERHRTGLAGYNETGHGELIDQEVILELPALRKDGVQITIEFSLTPIGRIGDDSGRFALALIRDVTERVELDQLRNDFVAMVAHDLRSPMSVIAGFAETLKKRWDRLNDDQRIMLLDGITRNVYSLDHLVEDVLQVARLESGEFSYEVDTFDLAALVRRTVDEFNRPEGRPTVIVEIEEDLPAALGDELRNWQILNNLLSNAMKYSQLDSVVRVEVVRLQDELRISVIDTGVGVAEQDIARLFGKFSRVSQGGGKSASGTGLGLYICRLMVEAQGGTIGVNTRQGEGSTFFYTLPIAGTPS